MPRRTSAELQAQRVTGVEALPYYKIHVVFSDGLEGDFSMKRFLYGEAFGPLRDESYFRRVSINECGAVCWPNGSDLAPDVMHDKIGKASGKRFRRWYR